MPSVNSDVSSSFSFVSPADIVPLYTKRMLLPRRSNSSTRAFADCRAVNRTFNFVEKGFGFASKAAPSVAVSSSNVAVRAIAEVLAAAPDVPVQSCSEKN